MGMSREFAPVCDLCMTRADWSEWTSAEAKEQARAEGWIITGNRYKCVECVEGGELE